MKISYLFLIVLLFGGCTTKTLPPVKKYTINEDIKYTALHPANCKSLKVEFPKSSDEIFSKNIIYKKGLEKNSYYFSKWYETPNEMLYKSVLSILQNSKVCEMVLPEDFDGIANLTISMDILDFTQNFSYDKSYVSIKVLFYIKDKNGSIIAQKFLNENAECSSNDAVGAVKAFNAASKQLMQDFAIWLKRVML